MKRTPLTAWLFYAGTSLVVIAAAAALAASLVGTGTGAAVWVAASLAFTVQLAAFALLIAFRDEAQLFLMAWAGGMVLRFGVLGLCAWAFREEPLPRTPLLLSYVGFVFLLVLLEPLFLRWDLRT